MRDREADAADPDRIRFSPSILPPYIRRSKSIETPLPILYLKGISTGDFSEALAALLGKDAVGCRHPPSHRPPEGRSARRTHRVVSCLREHKLLSRLCSMPLPLKSSRSDLNN